jgi:succinate-acetate transporter protein
MTDTTRRSSSERGPNPTPDVLHPSDPTPFGLIAFGTAAVTTGTVLAGWWPHARADMVALAPLLLVLGGLAQFVVAMWCYARRQAAAATFFATFGTLFTAVALYAMAAPALPSVTISVLGPLGVATACYCFVALVLASASAGRNPGLALTSLVLAVSLFFVSWSLFAQANTTIAAIGGWIGLVSGAVALLTAAALSAGEGLERVGIRVPGAAASRPQVGSP